jgi:uncharacterized protein (DUF302 family)
MDFVRNMMFTVHRSELDFDETVEALRTSAEKHGWDIPMVHDLQNNYQEAGYEDMTRVTTLYFCNPDGGYRILRDDENKPMAVMMPMGVSVYETQDGEVYIAGMNLERMSIMFGGEVKEVLRQGTANYARTMADIGELESGEEIEVDGGRCCLGCVSLAAVGTALAGVVVFIAVKVIPKLMPKLMSKMMPKMMAMMEEADVQPPCAQIILERLETEQAE